MDLLENSKYVRVDNLPDFLQEYIIRNDSYIEYEGHLFEGYKEEDDDEYWDNEIKLIKYVEYPSGLPIAFSNFLFDGGLEITSRLGKSFNLERIDSITCFANSITFFKKQNENDVAYGIFDTGDGDYSESFVILIK